MQASGMTRKQHLLRDDPEQPPHQRLGSLDETQRLAPDRTRQRSNSFFDEGMVVHIGFAEPFCPSTSKLVRQSAQELGVTVHPQGTMVVMEGPAFSTKAESFMYRSWGADIIGMTGT